VTGVTYNNANTGTVMGALLQVNFGSADNDAFQYDFNRAYDAIQVQCGNIQLGNRRHQWNSNGTVTSLNITDTLNAANTQSCAYTYDNELRLASVGCGTSGWNQNFTYNPYGNIKKSVPSGSGQSYLSTHSATTTATNRLTLLGSLTPTMTETATLRTTRLTALAGTPKGKCSPQAPPRQSH
jgi:hypothetical protein